MPSRQSRSVLHRALGAALSGLILAGILAPGAALAGPGGPPSPLPDTIITLEDTPATGNVLDNDVNLGEGTLTVTATGALSPSVGTLVIADDGAYTFTPASGFVGSDSTTYTVENDKHSRTVAIDITVEPLDAPPVAHDDTVTVDEDTATDLSDEVLANDTDADSGPLTITGVANESGGDADVEGGVLTFTPDANACGDAAGSFDYTITDGTSSDTASVTVDVTCVNDDPEATDDDASGTEDTDVEIAAADLVANDSDVETVSLTVSHVSNAAGGSVTLDSGTVTFTPTPDLCGDNVASFHYTVDDGDGGTDTGTVTIDLTCVNDGPVAVDDDLAGDEDTDVVASGDDLTANDTDVDGDELTVTDVSNPTGGTVSLDQGVVTFAPDAESCRDDAGGFDYVLSDGTATDTGHVTIDITCANDDPVATDDEADGTEDEDVVIAAADLAANDSDVEDVALTVTGADNASGGTVTLDSGTITFTPDADLCGDAAAGFDYTVEDADGGTDTGHVSIDLTCVNDDPVAGDDDATVIEDTATDVTDGLLADDTDVDQGDTLSITDVSNATGGTVGLAGGIVTFTPSANVCGDDAGGFDYVVSDGTATDTGHVTVDVTCVNDAPVVVDDEASGTEDEEIVLSAADLAEDDTDPDAGDTLIVGAVSDGTGGTVELDGDVITFTPAANLCGNDVADFFYTVGDGTASAAARVTIDLTCVNDAPVAVDDTASVLANSPAADHAVLANDTDVEGDTLSLDSATVDAAAGTVTIDGGEVEYTPKTGFTGQAIITYVVSDGEDTDTGTLTVTVGGDVTPPVVTAATVAFFSTRVDSAAPLKVNWSATDVPSGVASYEVQVSIAGAAFKPVYSGTATSIKALFPFGKRLVFRTRATDGVGNLSGWTVSSTRRVLAFQNGHERVQVKGVWRTVREPRSSGSGHAFTTQKDASVKVTFKGRSVMYIAPKGPQSGKVRVIVDGSLVGKFDLASPTARFGKVISRTTWSSHGTHRIRVQAVNAGLRANFDVFLVLK